MKGRRKVLILLVCLFAWRAAGQTPGAAAAGLAREIAAALEREPASLTFRNLSSLSPARAGEVRADVEAGLRAAGVKMAETAAAKIRVALSENPSYWLLIAEVNRGETRTVAISNWPRTPPSAATLSPAVSLERRLVLEQDEPILDFAVIEDAPDAYRLFVLEPERVAIYARSGGAWERLAEVALAPAAVRDLRGRLIVQAGRFQAYLPGLACRGVLDPLSLECAASDVLWPLVSGASLAGHAPFGSGRNAFDGPVVTAAGAKAALPAFYSMALAGGGAVPSWVVSAMDGRTLVYDAALAAAEVSAVEWGSDIAGVEARCGQGRQVLATRNGAAGDPDAVQAWEIGPGGPVPVSSPLEFSGPVTALWPSGAASAAAVVRDPETGRYAAYHLAIGCGS